MAADTWMALALIGSLFAAVGTAWVAEKWDRRD